MSFKMTSLNVKGLNSSHKRQMAWKKANKLKSDIICFQEMHFAAHIPPSFQHRNFPHLLLVNGPSIVAVAVKNDVQFKDLNTYLDISGRYLVLACEIHNAKHTLVNIYLPNTKQASFLKKIWKKVSFMRGTLMQPLIKT